MRGVLRNRVYLGESRYVETVNVAAHPPLVDPDTWERAQFDGFRTPARRWEERPLLWGIVRCAYCRRPLSSVASFSGPQAGIGSYGCRAFRAPARCPSPVRILQSTLDPYVERLLEGFAFLAARLQMRMDAEFPRFTQHLFEMVYPHYVCPTPSMAVVPS